MKRKITNFFISFLKILLVLALLLGLMGEIPQPADASSSELNRGYAFPDAQGWGNPNKHGITVGEITKEGNSYVIEGSEVVNVEGLGGEQYKVIETNVTVERFGYGGTVIQSVPGKALHYTDKDQNADNGYVLVDREEAKQWIKVLNGDEAYVFSGGVVNQYTVETSTFVTFKAYNLAEIALACGGAGGDNGIIESGGTYQKYNKFKASVRPEGSVSTNKSTYKVNETVSITATTKDYSLYNNGIFAHSLSVRNLNGSQQQQLISSSPVGSTWNGTFVPTEVGTYEVKLIITDKHDRTVDGSSDMTTSRPITATFTVEAGACLPTTATLQISGMSDKTLNNGTTYQLPSGKNTITLVFSKPGYLTIPGREPIYGTTFSNILITTQQEISYESADKTLCGTYTIIPPVGGPTDPGYCDYTIRVRTFTATGMGEIDTNIPSDPNGSAMELNERTEYLEMNANKPGKFYIDGVAIPSATGTTASIDYVPTGVVFTLKYTSNDGTECWVKKFYVSEGEGTRSCPRVKMDGFTVSNNETIKVAYKQDVHFEATYTDRWGETKGAEVFWEVTDPYGKKTLLRVQQTDRGDRGGRLDPWPVSNFYLPNTDYGSDKEVGFNVAGGIYTLRLVFTGTAFEGMNCNWQIKIEVGNCTTYERGKISLYGYGEPPSSLPPAGKLLSTSNKDEDSWFNDPVYFHNFTRRADGTFDTHMDLKANTIGTWFVQLGNTKIPLTSWLAADQRFRLILPQEVENYVGSRIRVFLVSDIGCVKGISIELLSGDDCFTPEIFLRGMDTRLPGKKVRWGETLTFTNTNADFIMSTTIKIYTSEKMEGQLYILDEKTQKWVSRYNNRDLWEEDDPSRWHSVSFPAGTGSRVSGLYMIDFWDSNPYTTACDGYIIVRILPPNAENLLIVKESFTITPNQPQEASTAATISFEVKNEGNFTHHPKLAVRWETAPAATYLDVPDFKPGETRRITIPTIYPPRSMNFIANINPEGPARDPLEETNWQDNRAQWFVSVVFHPPGGNVDGGDMSIAIYDSTNRQLTSTSDGVWEREPARIEVSIDQPAIDAAFASIDTVIYNAIKEKEAEYQSKYSAPSYENVVIASVPATWNSKTNPLTEWPSSTTLEVFGPGVDQTYQLNPKLQTQSQIYTGTSVPTQTTWQTNLQTEKYQVLANQFSIKVPYFIQFSVRYNKCEENGASQKICTTGEEADSLSGTFFIIVKGDKTQFEVFEPNARGYLRHTAEWSEYHSRDRYPQSRLNDFYAGERMLTTVQLEERHRHPFSGKHPVILSAQSWISETGQRSTLLQSMLSLQASGSTQWNGPPQLVEKLGMRETGVDSPLMGDKQFGFKKGASYAVYYQVQFSFGVSKGFTFPNKSALRGHDTADYRTQFTIIANAWERQGIRNHTSR